MNTNIDYNLPFFSYGVFRPGEISFLGIKEFVKTAESKKIIGSLVLRDGITLFKKNYDQSVDGFLISFKDGMLEKAYDFIERFEPNKLFKWGEETSDNNERFNILIGIKPDRGSENIEETDWKTIWGDPYFNSAIEVLNETPTPKFHRNLKPLFKLQMKYMLLWTIIERFTFLRYGSGENPTSRNNVLSSDSYFQEALKLYVNEKRYVFDTKDPDDKRTLDNSEPKKSIQYYYQVRCNITHRGKAVVRDYETVKKSFQELFKITKYILNKTKEECLIIKSQYEK